jgi:hypothetical protein
MRCNLQKRMVTVGDLGVALHTGRCDQHMQRFDIGRNEVRSRLRAALNQIRTQ